MIDLDAIRARLDGATFRDYAEADLRALLAELDASNAEYAKLQYAALAAYNVLNAHGEGYEARGILFDALELDGAPQDGGVTDPHETSGPPTIAERFKSRPAGGTRVELVNRNGDRPHYHGNVAPDEAQPADPQRVRVDWDDLVTSTVRCEQLRPETRA